MIIWSFEDLVKACSFYKSNPAVCRVVVPPFRSEGSWSMPMLDGECEDARKRGSVVAARCILFPPITLPYPLSVNDTEDHHGRPRRDRRGVVSPPILPWYTPTESSRPQSRRWSRRLWERGWGRLSQRKEYKAKAVR